MLPIPLFSGLLLGAALGANTAANVFGTAVASRVISYRLAAVVCGIAIILGAYLQGEGGIVTYHNLVNQDLHTAVVIACAAALTIAYMTVRKLSVSSSQAMVGGILAIGLIKHTVDWGVLLKVIICWLATPLTAIVMAILLYHLVGYFLRITPMSMLTRDKFIWVGLIIFGVYGAYALGANCVANATGIFSGIFSGSGITDGDLALWGGGSIAFGAMFFGKRVMLAVGKDVMRLNGFTALISVAASSMTVHLYAFIGVPISTNQALIGAIVGIGLLRNPKGLHLDYIKNIATGWVLSPVITLVLTAAGYALTTGV